MDREELLKLARVSGDAFKESSYYASSESFMDEQWDTLVWPMIHELDFTCVLDLAAGHGRNSAKLLPLADQLIIVDINQENIDFCRERFRGVKKIRYLKTDGTSLMGIDDGSVSLIYCFDSMVHFDSDVVREYLGEFFRVLKPGGCSFCHHSNYTEVPGGDIFRSPAWRNFMSKEMFAHYAVKEGLQVVKQLVFDWEEPNLDCVSLLQKP